MKKGDYVLATKYKDGDPGDAFVVGFYAGNFDSYGEPRHLVNDGNGNQFRANGFRRVARIGAQRGRWIVEHFAMIEGLRDQFSVWHWHRAPWSELRSIQRRTKP